MLPPLKPIPIKERAFPTAVGINLAVAAWQR